MTDGVSWYRDGDRILVECVGHRGAYVLDQRGTVEEPEYVYVYVPERM